MGKKSFTLIGLQIFLEDRHKKDVVSSEGTEGCLPAGQLPN